MKKWTLWLIVVAMALALIGLLLMQLNYVDVVYRFRNEQFDSRVRQALSSVSQDVERDEMSRLVSDRLGFSTSSSLLSLENNLKDKSKQLQIDSLRFGLDQLPQDPLRIANKQSPDRIQEASRELMKAFTERYSEVREMVIQLAIESVRDNNPAPIYERISERDLDLLLSYYLTNNGITLPYIYELVDNNHRAYYSSGRIPPSDADATYTQVLFPNDNPSHLYFVKLLSLIHI